MKRFPKVMKLEELKKLNTKRLLSYLKLLHKCEESFEESDLVVNLDIKNDDIIQFKNTEKWKFTYQQVKSILNEREHVEKK